MKAAIYARVSTLDQDCGIQVLELNAFCARADWTVFSTYIDDGYSGASRIRPAHLRLMADASMRLFDVVLVWKLDRFGRSVLDLLDQLAALDRYHVRFLAVSQGIDTDLSNPAGRLQLNILAAVAEYERELISERVREGVAKAKREGRMLGRPRRVFDAYAAGSLRASGLSWRQVAIRLDVSPSTVRRAVAKIPLLGVAGPAL